LVAMKAGLLPADAHLYESDKEPKTLTLFLPRALSGRVVRDGQPVADVQVALDGEHKKLKHKSDQAGQFHFEQLRPGKYSVEAIVGDELSSTTVTVKSDADKTGVELSLSRGGTVEGVVKDESGAPIKDASVGSYREKDEGYARARTDESGH